MERFNEVRKLAREEIEQRKALIVELENKIVELEQAQQDLEDEMIVMLEWIEDLKRQQEQLTQQCEELETEIREKKLPNSLIEKCATVLKKIKAVKLNKQEEKGLKITLSKQEKKELASELVNQSNIGVELKPLVQEALNDQE